MARRLAAGSALITLLAGSGALASLPAQADEPTGAPDDQLDVSVGASGQLNVAGTGLVRVVVAGSDRVAAADIDPESVTVSTGAGSAEPARSNADAVIADVTDVDGDGRDDLVVHFDKESLAQAGLDADTDEVVVSADLTDGGSVRGIGDVRPEVVLEVKFEESLAVRGADTALRSARGADLNRVDAVLERFEAERLRPFVAGAAAERLREVAAEAEERTGEPAPDLTSWYTLTLPAHTDVDEALAELRELPEIAFAEIAPDPVPPPQVPNTPDFRGLQRYFRTAAENGIDADFSRADPRLRGAGIKIVDFEYDWNEHHEDLQLPDPGTDLGGTQFAKYRGFNDQHGTAVMGVLAALDNDYGITGGVPDVTLYGLSPTRASGAYAAGPSLAYLAALQDSEGNSFLQPGDAVLIEQQGGQVIPNSDCPVNPGTCYSPLEWNVAVHQAVTLLSSMGVTVISTGGNGYNSTDHPAYTRSGLPWFRPENHSGSIFVGAANNTTRERLAYSNHGPRFDLQGWGQGIATTGHGGTSTNFWPTTGGGDPATLNYRYTASFGGTSGAGPIVTTAVVAIQSYLKATGQEPWSAQQIADVLKATGQPQGPNTAAQHIGPLPNLRAALISIEVDPPETTLAVDGEPVRAGSYISPIITLEAEDGWGSGVERTEYRIDDGDWTTYDGPFKLTEPGVHTFSFRSVDDNGNAEDTAAAQIDVADCAQTITGSHDGSLPVSSGVTCLAEGATVTGPVTVANGAGLVAIDASVDGPVFATGASTAQLYRTTVNGPVFISGSTGRVAIAESTVTGPVTVRGNTTGDVPALISGNTVDGRLTCTANEPAPVNDGVANTVTGPKSGQCAEL